MPNPPNESLFHDGMTRLECEEIMRRVVVQLAEMARDWYRERGDRRHPDDLLNALLYTASARGIIVNPESPKAQEVNKP
jgi:hypothetical protein